MSKKEEEEEKEEKPLFKLKGKEKDQDTEKVIETYIWNSSKRIVFYSEKKTEKQKGRVYIIKTPREPPSLAKSLLMEAADRNGVT